MWERFILRNLLHIVNKKQIAVKVQAAKGKIFRGILIQARNADNARVGTFSTSDANVKAMECDIGVDSALTHVKRNDKTVITANWTAPDDDQGNIEFV